ncbi:MAG: DUF3426 domain-containing protein [Nitrosomonadales bacterium]|nr:DUF3426 domain-containing protein [Nitrosomonadales bacterium]
MTDITRCPECGTRFKVTDAQLDAHDGLVRCGHCHDIFDARKYLHDDEPSPQLSLPIDPIPQPGGYDLTPIPDVPELEEEPRTLAQQVQFIEELTDEVPEASARKISWTGVLIAASLALMLLGQAAYHFRVELGARLPGLKPLLTQYCELLACTVTLPQKIDLMVLESSELESDPAQNNIVILHALIHNRALFAQTYPSLELTLTDMQDQAIARRVFHPGDYLKTGTDEKQGASANRDLDIRLRLDTTDLKPSGYRLFLFYPK